MSDKTTRRSDPSDSLRGELIAGSFEEEGADPTRPGGAPVEQPDEPEAPSDDGEDIDPTLTDGPGSAELIDEDTPADLDASSFGGSVAEDDEALAETANRKLHVDDGLSAEQQDEPVADDGSEASAVSGQ